MSVSQLWRLPLTKRESEVASLIAHGLTNRRIGQQLFIAERTVDTHVSRILAKLVAPTVPRWPHSSPPAGARSRPGKPTAPPDEGGTLDCHAG
jgi:Bacterial regulatory proteins, luxR family